MIALRLNGGDERPRAARRRRRSPAARDELVELAAALIALRHHRPRARAIPPRDGGRSAGATSASGCGAAARAVDIWEPAPGGRRRHAADPGRARLRRPAAAGRALRRRRRRPQPAPQRPHRRRLGRADASAGRATRTRAEVRDGKLYGRGACDMKGGVAAMVFAAEVLARLGVRLAGDLIVSTVTDEESSGAGGIAAVRHGVRADAGIVTEPTGFDVWVALPRLALPDDHASRAGPGHAEMRQPHWRDGGAVNAIEKARRRARRRRPAARGVARPRRQAAPVPLAAGDIVPDGDARGGEWSVTYPASCTVTCELMYLPGATPTPTAGARWSRRSVEEWIAPPRAGRPVAGRAPADRRVGIDIPPMRDRPGRPDRGRRCWTPSADGRRAVAPGRPRLLVRRRHVHALRRHAVDRASARATSRGPHDRRVRAGRRPRALRAGAGRRGDALLRDGMSTRILLVARHGQATQGPDHVWTPDDPLTELGHRQAADLAEHVKRAAPAPDAHRREPVPARPADGRAVGRGARARDRDRSLAWPSSPRRCPRRGRSRRPTS